ncbi:SAF domain-containing protein [Streptomyces chattanoogensis]|uniref:SAF domain-containing protein n=1 Tax=Streptomyces chattanoogensis TaxID=66876 RepID=UPI0036A31033
MSKIRTPQPASEGVSGTAHARPVSPPRVAARRRRPGMIALCVLLIAGGGVGGALLFLQSGQRSEVLTLVREVPAGAAVTDQDLGEASMALDPAVKSVPASERDSIVGKRAAVDLKPGSLLSASQVTTATLLKAGELLVPVGLKPEQVPASVLSPGTRVQIVRVPGESQTAKGEGDPEVISARVVKVGSATPGTGTVVIDVATASANGPQLAAWVSTGNVRLVIDALGGGS